MSRRFYIETSATGHGQFVKLKRSRSYHHDHHHHLRRHSHHHEDHDHHHLRRHSHHHEDHDHHHHQHIPSQPQVDPEYYKIRKEEWGILKERDRILTDNNKILTTENQDLRTNLSDVQAEVHRLGHMVVPDMQCQVTALQADNAGLRRSLETATEHAEKHHREVDKLQGRIDKLERDNMDVREENTDLRSRIKSLTKQLDGSSNRRLADMAKELGYWKDQARSWKARFEDLADKLEFRTQRVDAYEDILKRRRFV